MLVRQRDRDVKAVQQAGVMEDRNGDVLAGVRSVMEEINNTLKS